MSLTEPHLKMSKSHQNPRSRIHIDDAPEIIRDKIKLALTDSVAGVSFDQANRPGISNLLSIMSFLDGTSRTAEDIAQAYSGMSMREFKAEATAIISEGLASTRKNYTRLINADNAHYLSDVAMEGSAKAREQAGTTMAAVRRVIGL